MVWWCSGDKKPRDYTRLHRGEKTNDIVMEPLYVSTFYKNQQKSHIMYMFAFNLLACLKKYIVAEFCGNYKAKPKVAVETLLKRLEI